MRQCELCWRDATHADSSAIDVGAGGHPHGPIAHRDRFLCPVHAAERRQVNTARVRCLHVDLDADGACRECGADCR